VSLLYLPFWPLVWRYSRVLWVHLEYALGPSDTTAYERFRRQELAGQSGTQKPDDEAPSAPPPH
jgi:hypothetical protein